MRSKLIGQRPEYYKLYEIQRKLEQITRMAPNIGWNTGSTGEETPSIQASDLIVTEITDVSVTVEWARGDGDNVLIIAKEGGAVDSLPVDEQAYTANPVFGVGDQLGAGNYAVYSGTGTSVTISGLSPDTAIHIRAFEFDGALYLTDTASGNPASTTTFVEGYQDVVDKGNGIEPDIIPTNKSVTFSFQSPYDIGEYLFSAMYHQNPLNKDTVIWDFGRGNSHSEDHNKKLVAKRSSDRALTFGDEFTLYDPVDGNYQVQDPARGYSSDGRFHILADVHTVIGTNGGDHEVRYMYSDNDGDTISTPSIIELPVGAGYASIRLYGKIIEGAGNVLVAPCYLLKDDGDFSESARYVMRSTDNGANWSWVEVEGDTGEYINEGELLYIGSDVWILMCRHETTKQFVMYKSTDNASTWTRVGHFDTTVAKTVADPCRLHKFRLDDGTWVAVMYFVLKGVNPRKIYAIYGLLDDFISGGTEAWNTDTLTEMYSNSVTTHYGDVLHYNNNMNARGVYPREQSTVPLEDNEIARFELSATQYNSVEALLTA